MMPLFRIFPEWPPLVLALKYSKIFPSFLAPPKRNTPPHRAFVRGDSHRHLNVELFCYPLSQLSNLVLIET